MYIAIEGPDGVGKTTQARMLANLIEKSGRKAVLVREPGGTPLGDAIRSIIMSDLKIDPKAELMLFSAARRALINEVVRPALIDGAVVISDRCFLSSLAYQCMAGGVPFSVGEDITRLTVDGCYPNAIVVLAATMATLGARRWSRMCRSGMSKTSKFEEDSALSKAIDFYCGLAAAECICVDTNEKTIEDVNRSICVALTSRFPPLRLA